MASQIFVVHVIQSGWFFLSRTGSSGSDNLHVGLHLLVKDSQGPPDHTFDKHTDEDTFGRPIGKSAVDLPAVVDFCFLFLRVAF